MKLKVSAALVAACCALAPIVGVAKADSVFDIQGTFSSGGGGTLSGTLTIDVTAGSVTGINAIYSTGGVGPLLFNNLVGSFPAAGGWQVSGRDFPAFDTVFINFSTPPTVPPAFGTLVGFNGGEILSGTLQCLSRCFENAGSLSGSITPSVPGPIVGAGLPGLLLLACGGLLALRWRGHRKIA